MKDKPLLVWGGGIRIREDKETISCMIHQLEAETRKLT